MSTTDLPDPVYVDTPEKLSFLAARLSGVPIFAVDTESNSLFAYREQVCLIQISTLEEDYVIDPLVLHDYSGSIVCQ
jgi:ribonuclease D